jgi:hypothetical protein
MKIIIAGGSGQIGTILARHFSKEGHHVIILSRSPKSTLWPTVYWDGESRGDWIRELEGADCLINLTGRIINCRYTWKNRCDIWSSRTRSVRVLGEAIQTLKRPPSLWLQAGTATIYTHRFDAANDELTGVIGGSEVDAPGKWRFSIDVARAWEGEFSLIETPGTRKVILRSAITLSHDPHGIFDYLLWLVRYGLGGTAGSGKQYISWIHFIDFIRAIEFIIGDSQMSGAVNIASPNPLPNKDFMEILRRAWGQKLGLPASKWMLELGALLLRTETELVLKSRRVVPRRILDAGFSFAYEDWKTASMDLCERWRKGV